MGTIFEKREGWHSPYTEDINYHDAYPPLRARRETRLTPVGETVVPATRSWNHLSAQGSRRTRPQQCWHGGSLLLEHVLPMAPGTTGSLLLSLQPAGHSFPTSCLAKRPHRRTPGPSPWRCPLPTALALPVVQPRLRTTACCPMTAVE